MVTEQYFPESWGEAQLAEMGGVTGSVYISSMPEFGEPTELGVRLTVTPTVDPDRYTITLDMVPVVQTHVGWTDYSYEQITSSGTVQNILRMPIIEARTVETQLTIYDGETVVLGGIMRDNTSYIDDRIPILGDLPLVGRFFRSKGVNAQKNNLLIFTTPRLVNPNGAPLRQREVRGKPPFRM
jgi:general secretion pathway protein D